MNLDLYLFIPRCVTTDFIFIILSYSFNVSRKSIQGQTWMKGRRMADKRFRETALCFQIWMTKAGWDSKQHHRCCEIYEHHNHDSMYSHCVHSAHPQILMPLLFSAVFGNTDDLACHPKGPARSLGNFWWLKPRCSCLQLGRWFCYLSLSLEKLT